jgi:2'-5' RNA ligase
VRCFLALPIGDEAKAEISEAMAPLKRANPGFRWTNPEGFHLTLAFLGEIDGKKLECAKRAADAAVAIPSFPLVLGGLMRFPPRGNFRVLSLAFREGVEECVRVYERVNEALERLGREAGFLHLNPEWPNGRAFVPHLTLARAGKEGNNPQPEAFSLTFRVKCDISSCRVYESVLGRGGAAYTPLHIVPLAERVREDICAP